VTHYRVYLVNWSFISSLILLVLLVIEGEIEGMIALDRRSKFTPLLPPSCDKVSCLWYHIIALLPPTAAVDVTERIAIALLCFMGHKFVYTVIIVVCNSTP